jgi:EAL domain-containing protein (putative c-di-GMP-specific phosphodiesterase class I)
MEHPELGLTDPGKFVPIAEKTDLIVKHGEWAIMTACRQNKQWHDMGLKKLPVLGQYLRAAI